MIRVYLVFRSTHETLKAEATLQGAGLPCRVVQKPRAIPVECGLALRTGSEHREAALVTLRTARLEPRGIYDLDP